MGFFGKIANLLGQSKESEQTPPKYSKPLQTTQTVAVVSSPKTETKVENKVTPANKPSHTGQPASTTSNLTSQPALKNTTTTNNVHVNGNSLQKENGKPSANQVPEQGKPKPVETKTEFKAEAKVENKVESKVDTKIESKVEPKALSNAPARIAVAPVETFGAPNKALTVEAKQESIFGDISEEDDFDAAFDAAFEELEAMGKVAHSDLDSSKPVESEMTHQDEAAVQDLFVKIAANYARPIKNFVFELKHGTATKEWLEICKPAMHSISRAADGMGLKYASNKMMDFEEAIALAQSSEGRILQGEVRDLLMSCYEELVQVMPDAFTIGEEEQQREGIIINSLLKQIHDVGRVTVEKLYRAGLTSLDMLFMAKKEEMAVASGIPIWLAERICDKFQDYKKSLEGDSRDVAQSGYRARLVEMLNDLKKQHDSYEYASANEWSDPSLSIEKRKYRQTRQDCALQINVLLAEIGDVDFVSDLQKLSFERRIESIQEYISKIEG